MSLADRTSSVVIKADAPTPTMCEAIVASEISHFLGEGPLWDPVRERVHWVDIMAGEIFSGRLTTDGLVTVEENFRIPGTAGALALSADGSLLIAGRHSLFRKAVDGALTEGAALIRGVDRRLNDGAPDPIGRFVVGTKSDGGSSREELLRVSLDGAVGVLDEDLLLSNGVAWSPDGRAMYSIDTLDKSIYVREYSAISGEHGERRRLTRIEGGYPDGMTIDAAGCLWVAIWGGGCVLRISPEGTLLGRIDLPVPHISSLVYGGPHLDTLVITTARENLSEAELEEYPLSGRLFTAQPGVLGLPPLYAELPPELFTARKGRT